MEIVSLKPALDELERTLEWAAQPTGITANQRIVPTIQTGGRRRASGHSSVGSSILITPSSTAAYPSWGYYTSGRPSTVTSILL